MSSSAPGSSGGRRRLRRGLVPLVTLASALVYAALATLSLQRGNALLIGLVLVGVSLVPFLLRFERKERQARDLVLIAVMAAVAVIGRIPFAALLPSFTPVTFVVIVSGVVFGAEAGWMVGAVSALVSNFAHGQGAWTPWQMFAWGLVGYTAGLIWHRRPAWRRRLPLALFGLAWGFGFGWLMNLTLAIDQWAQTRSWAAVAGVYARGLPFEAIHAAANVFFLSVFGPAWIALLERYRNKYGALRREPIRIPREGDD